MLVHDQKLAGEKKKKGEKNPKKNDMFSRAKPMGNELFSRASIRSDPARTEHTSAYL